MDNKFTQKAENALISSLHLAEEFGHTYIGTEHLLLALAEDEASCSALVLNRYSVSANKIKAIICDYSGTGLKSSLTPNDMTPRLKSILEESYDLAVKYGNGVIGTEHILLSILGEDDSVAIKLLKKMKANLNGMRDEIQGLLKIRDKHSQPQRKDVATPLLKQYGRNLCEMAREDRFDPVIGRDAETERIIRILLRKTKNNPCLIGEAGVGKTAIIEGLAARIVRGDVPEALMGKTIISIDLTSMVAGAKYRGDFEDRIKSIVSETVKNKNIILFVDEIHTIVGAGAAEGAIDASNILKPQLARGELRLIGATTLSEYHRYIEKDSALERRFQPVIISEPSKDATINMLHALKERYERHHNVIIRDEAISDCVQLSSRYINDRFLPDKAIDVLDEACVIAVNNSIKSDKPEQNNSYDQTQSSNNSDSVVEAFYREHTIHRALYKTNPLPQVRSCDVKSAISEICNIPLKMIKTDIDYDEIRDRINAKLPGRESITQALISTIKKQDLGFSEHNRPRGIFLFVGESGTGKTAMAIELSRALFFRDNSLLRYDMSEFSEKHSISKLIGSPPGYVGYDEGGGLTEAVRKNPHSLILFDEIDKADREVLNIILQIADYGYMKDSSGRKVDFRNTVIVMTSNQTGRAVQSKGKLGFVENLKDDGRSYAISAIEKHYSNEFINRFDEIVYFDSIDCEFLAKIAEGRLSNFAESVIKNGHDIKFCPEVSSYIAKISANSLGGIRGLHKNISDRIEKPIIEMITSKKDGEPMNFYVCVEGDRLDIRQLREALLG